ncbi:MAG: DUF1192 domain-containing protein [Rhodovibrionaceae bacterium]
MDSDDLEPRKPAKSPPKDLESLGVEELEDYIADLQAELERVRAKLATKKDYKAGAEAFFKS